MAGEWKGERVKVGDRDGGRWCLRGMFMCSAGIEGVRERWNKEGEMIHEMKQRDIN